MNNRLTQGEIKQIFNKKGVQIGEGTLDLIYSEIRILVTVMADRCQEGNIKRLTPDLFWAALGKVTNERQ